MRSALGLILLLQASAVCAQTISQRGFVEGEGTGFFEPAVNDAAQLVGNGVAREEVFVHPVDWFQFAAGAEVRANSHGQVEDEWRFDIEDRSILRPRVALRR